MTDGNLLIESPPTILDEDIVKEGLKISFEWDGKTMIADLIKDLLLGERLFDPFLLIQVMEKIPSMIAWYSNVARASKRALSNATKVRTGIESMLRKSMADRIVELREKSTKPASKDEVDTEFHRAIHVKASEYSDLSEYLKALENEEDWEDKVAQMDIILRVWHQHAQLIRTESRLMETMLQQNLISIPERRSVYKEWPGEYRKTSLVPIGSEEDDGKF